MKFILGSGSPRRKMIIESLVGNVDIVVPSVDESWKNGEIPESYAKRVLDEKLDAVLSTASNCSDCVILVSDTIVTIDQKVLGKPSSRDDAYIMLSELSGREHDVISGIKLSVSKNNIAMNYAGLEYTKVRFRSLDDALINRYLDMTDYSDKAGAYAIQENGGLIVEGISGSITNVIGFPLRLFFTILDAAGIRNEVFLGGI